MDFYTILKTAFDGGFNNMSYKDIANTVKNPLINVVKLEEGCQFIELKSPMDNIYLTLEGECSVVKYSNDDKTIIIDVLPPVQLFGLYELLNEELNYKATVTAYQDVIAIKIPSDILNTQISENIALCRLIAKYLANLMSKTAIKNEQALINTGMQNLVLYLHKYCYNKAFPVTIKEERETLATELNINLRTLYRYLKKLKNEDVITIQNRKIIISREQFVRIDQISREINW